MYVVVCVKQVPDTTQVQIDPVTKTLIREGIPLIMNPYDTHALEESLRLKDRYGLKVAALSMGPPNAAGALRKALSLGVDKAILLSDRAFGGADTLATSLALSAAILRLQAEDEVALVLCGKQTIDGDTAQVGPGIATRLGHAQLTLVDRIEQLDLSARRIRVRRKLEGRHEIVEGPLPAMLTVVRGDQSLPLSQRADAADGAARGRDHLGQFGAGFGHRHHRPERFAHLGEPHFLPGTRARTDPRRRHPRPRGHRRPAGGRAAGERSVGAVKVY